MNDPELLIECAVEAGDWPAEDALLEMAQKAISAAITASDIDPDELGPVSLLFTDDAHIRVLNAQWRGKDKPTNVLSFPAAQPAIPGVQDMPLGDIILAHETLMREANAEAKPFDHHLAHLLIHGFLHLLGYDHETGEEAEEMEALERLALKGLAIPDPYA